MNKKQEILIGIAFMLLFTGIALATSSASSNVIIYAFDQNPAGSDEGNEWLTLYNPSNESVEKGDRIYVIGVKTNTSEMIAYRVNIQ